MKPIIFISFLFFLLTGCGNNDDINTIDASGNIEATNVIVSSKVSGEVTKIIKDEGETVLAGDTVIILDHEILDLQLRQAIAGVDLAKAQLSLLRNGARDEDISQAKELFNQAEINYAAAKTDLDRMINLKKEDVISQKQYEDAQNRYNLALAQYNASTENLKKIKNIARPEELKQAQANLERQIAAADLLKKNIKDSYVKAPINGIIVKNFVEKGETVSILSSLFKVSDLRMVDLVIYVSEENLARIKLGQKADIRIDAFENKTYPGKITYISPEAEFTPKNIQTKDERTKLVFAVKIRIDNPAFELKPGMPADAVVHLK